ncbi:unnamed protein product [Hymenolepis diminuta]|uniref:Calmodulin n=1 Tax=Hymenolepis diminuta TaxID=6216 RepID=A0A0R3SYU0_HYMDI|nr:unnamed protein product [Hymenolepis diminuta]
MVDDPQMPTFFSYNAADQLTGDRILEFFETFSLFDKNRDGLITVDELRSVMKSLGRNLSQEELKEMIKEGDANGSGAIAFEEFLNMVIKSANTEENKGKLLNTFRLFDKDGNGFISTSELRQVLTALGEKLHEGQVEEMIRIADTDYDGQINYDGTIHRHNVFVIGRG